MELAKVNTAAIPPRYIRRPHQEQPTIIPSCEIPVVDLQRLLDQESMDPALPKLHLACKDGGSVQEEQQINVEVSRAAAAEEEAQGKGLVDGIMEVQKVTESSGDTAETRELNGVMEMETQTTTHSNPTLENAESSRKSKTILEWTLQITSLLLEATSAIFEQLGYPLTSMVMAFVALLLFILDLINKARDKEGISFDGRSQLPSFYRHDRHDQNREYFGFIGALGVVEYFGFMCALGVVEYFGFAAAVWQCSHTTVGYHYSGQNLDNPIKMCLLPFIFALCVLISKAVKSN